MANILSVLPPSVSTIHPHPTSLAAVKAAAALQGRSCCCEIWEILYYRYFCLLVTLCRIFTKQNRCKYFLSIFPIIDHH